MALSGSYDYGRNRNQIVELAYKHATIKGSGETLTDAEMADGVELLNLLVKGWQAEGIGLWLDKEATLYLEYQEHKYTIGPTATSDHYSLTTYETEIATAAASGATSIVVDSYSNITDGDYIGIELDDGTLQWTTANGTPTTTTVNLDDALTDTVAVDNVVFNYTSKGQRPLNIIEARIRDHDNVDTPLWVGSRSDYMEQSTKYTDGVVNQIFYDPQLMDGVLYTWPRCDDVQNRIKMTVKYPINDFDAAANDPDFPIEWILALSYGVSVHLCIQNGVADQIFNRVVLMAEDLKNKVSEFDQEKGPVRFGLERR